MPNRLAEESSPYLLQHAQNPVDWHPWGPEALERSKREDKPIFLSIGYSACHWCHVMEHESFEDPRIAGLMNENFVCIKVDREERPDLDQIYMGAVQAMTGRGGWPMSVFLTPEVQPFYGGTYWPPEARMGMPGFDQVLQGVAEAWRERRDKAIEQAAVLTEHLQELSTPPVAGPLQPQLLDGAAAALARSFDQQHGGFGGAPKFPHPMDLRLLLHVGRRGRRDEWLRMVALSLDKMAAGGIYDQLGGGFHRYSVDEHWLVPHFEKMLYDNALLTGAYLDGCLATGNADYARVARETCDWVLREMTDPEGGFYSTLDADSEGEEGKFYVWTPAEVADVLGPEAAKTFCYVYDISDEGNFERANILNMPKTLPQCAQIFKRDLNEFRAELAAGREKLLAARGARVRPGVDDKVLASWNGLMIDALAQASGVLDEPRYLAAAAKAADFLLARLRRGDGRLLHSWRGGVAKLDAYLDDYACLANALVSLYEASFDERWIDEAVRLSDLLLKLFADATQGGFYFTATDHEALIARHKDLFDNATPSGNAMAATALLRLGKLTGRHDFLSAAEGTLRSAAGVMDRAPTAAGQLLLAYDMLLGPTPEIVLLGQPTAPDTAAVLASLHHRFLPNKLVALRPPAPAADKGPRSPALDDLFAGKTAAAEPTVFICEHFACQSPASGKDQALAALDELEQRPAPGS